MRRGYLGKLTIAAALLLVMGWPGVARSRSQTEQRKGASSKAAPASRPPRPTAAPPKKKDAAATGGDREAAAPEGTPAERERAVKAGAAPKPAEVEVEVEQGEAGEIKTYKFGATELEGRLKSPQMAYFLRRVRAEFDAGDLGHRSFLRELSHTRQHAAFK
ncbi:MAG TPA: hypothetical protein VKZ49_08125 [Polyangiaceae bacterium]|nr:hypothetical protein [Polyangiaceae bacterium]